MQATRHWAGVQLAPADRHDAGISPWRVAPPRERIGTVRRDDQHGDDATIWRPDPVSVGSETLMS
jgi:hypothetical protein